MTCKYKVKIKDIQYNYKVQMTDIQSKYKFKVFCTGYDDSEIKEKIDAMYQAWPKATAEGETPTLDNTANATMSIDLKGNTYQDSTSGKNKLQYTLEDLKTNNTSGTWNNNVYTWNGITFTINDDLSITVNGTATTVSYIYVNFYNLGLISGTEYILNGCPSGGGVSTYSLRIYAGNSYSSDLGNGLSFTFNNQTIVRVNVSKETNVNNLLFQPMIRLSSVSDSSYEMYTNGASPNPDYPQDIHVVSGDNTINVTGKNLINTNVETKSAYPITTIGSVVSYGTSSASTSYVNCGYLEAGTTYTFSCKLNTPASTTHRDSVIVDKDNKVLEAYKLWNNTTSHTYTPTHSGYLVLCVDNNSTELMIEKNNEATTYEAYKGASYPISLGVENLWNTDKLKDGFISASGTYPINNTNFPNAKYLLVYLYKGQSLTIANQTDTGQRGRIRYIDKDTNLVIDNVRATTNAYYTSNFEGADGFKNGTITALKDFILAFMTIDVTDTRVNADVTYGTTPQYISDTPIELCKIGDYQDSIVKDNGKWYLHKEIGKFDLSSIPYWGKQSNGKFYLLGFASSYGYKINESLSNLFTYSSTTWVDNCFGITGAGVLWIATTDTTITSYDEFITWLDNKNAIMYGALATPTYTEITDSTLISQLEEIKEAESYSGQTNISQTNDDKPFILTAKALKDLSSL